MPLVAVVEESRTRPPMPRQKNVCCGHDCSGIVGSQKLLHKNLFRKVPLFVKCKVQIFISQSTDFHFAKYRLHFAKYRFSFCKVQISFCFVSQSTISHLQYSRRSSVKTWFTCTLTEFLLILYFIV